MKKLIILLAIIPLFCNAQKNIAYHAFECTYIGLNAMDVVSTYRIIELGGYEANSVMAEFVDNKAAFIGVKTVATVAFLGACRIIKKDKPKIAFALLLAGNIGYGFLLNHNYQVSVRLKI